MREENGKQYVVCYHMVSYLKELALVPKYRGASTSQDEHNLLFNHSARIQNKVVCGGPNKLNSTWRWTVCFRANLGIVTNQKRAVTK